MCKGVTLWRLRDLMNQATTVSVQIDNQWVPARPMGRTSLFTRMKAAWLVFTGKADAVVWPKGQ